MSNNLDELRSLLVDHSRFIVITHSRPDGDAIGSAFGMARILNDNGKQADVLMAEPIPGRYVDFQAPVHTEANDFPGFTDYTICICLDTAAMERIGLPDPLSASDITIPVINIDHHPDNKRFGRFNFIDPEAAATAEILYRAIKGIPSWSIQPEAATYLHLANVMDTGCFRFDNTDAAIMEVTSELLALGVDHQKIIKEMFFNHPLNYLRFQSDLILNHLRLAFDGRFAWFYLSPELIERYAIDIKNIEGLIDSVRAVAGVEIAAIIVHRDDGLKFSLRSKDPRYSVAEIARAINGGGHEMAAGGFLATHDVDLAEKTLLGHVEKVLGLS